MTERIDLKTRLSEIRAQIAAVKRRHTRGGDINARDCLEVTDEWIDILSEAQTALEHKDFVLAFSIASLIHQNLVKLALTADDSYGGVTNACWAVYPLVSAICGKVEYGSSEADAIFEKAIKDCGVKAFVGMDEFAYEILERTARLAQPKNIRKLYRFLDDFAEANTHLTSWYKGPDCVIRILATRAVEGEAAAQAMIEGNLHYYEVRQLAVDTARENGDWAKAESLILDYLGSNKYSYQGNAPWYLKLFEVYGQAANNQQQEALAKRLLTEEHDASYYEKLKQILLRGGQWEEQVDALLEGLSRSLRITDYLKILAKENKAQLLLEKIRQFPEYIIDYVDDLVDEFPKETYEVYAQAILAMAEKAEKRSKYRKVCAEIRKLIELGGGDEAMELLLTLNNYHSHQPAFMEELGILADQLERRPNRQR